MILGRIKFYAQRLVTYIQIAQFCMVVYLFLQQSDINPLWLVLAIPVGAFTVWFDYRYVLKGELAEFLRQNPEWTERNK